MTSSSAPAARRRTLTPSYRIEADLYERFARITAAQGASRSSVVNLLVKRYVDEHEAQAAAA